MNIRLSVRSLGTLTNGKIATMRENLLLGIPFGRKRIKINFIRVLFQYMVRRAYCTVHVPDAAAHHTQLRDLSRPFQRW